MEKVLVTGGSGFIALHCIDQLLEKGFMVRTTIRSESRKDEINKAMDKYPNLDQNLEFHICDLLEDKGWDAAVDGCDYVLHVASPFILEVPNDEDVLIRPAVDGTLRVLNACFKANVKKVVLTSSVAAVAYGHGREKIFDESDWSNTDEDSGITPYAKSKTLAEKAAWEFVEKLDTNNKFDFTVINPVGVFGPMLTSDMGTSNSLVSKLINGELPACPATHMGYVDVRDVARAHVFSMLNSSTNDKRIIVSESEMFFVDVGRILNNAGFKKSPTKQMPNWLVKILAIFVKELSGVTKSLGKRVDTDKSRAKSLFDWDYISAKDSIVDTANQLSAMDKK
jgi:dihydroflavonol-4-reductase